MQTANDHFLNAARMRILIAAAVITTFTAGCEKATRSENESKPFPGYTLIQQLTSNTTDLVDMEGRLVHRWTSKYGRAPGARLLPNGDLVRCGLLENSPFTESTPGLAGVVERLDWDGNLLWSFTFAEPTKTLHHDLEVLPNGNVLLTGIELKNKEQQLEAGRDPSRMRGDTLWIDYLIEIKPTGRSGGEIVWQWNAWDHLVQDHDSKRKNHGAVAEHPERIDVNFIETPVPIIGSRMQLLQSIGYVGGQKVQMPSNPSVRDWTHVNALSYNPQTDQILLTVRSLGEVWIIDHSTSAAQAAGNTGGRYGKGGGLLYRWGNPQAYQRGKPTDQRLFGPHDGQWISPGLPGAGNVLIFNNGDGRRDGAYSSIEELQLPVLPDGSFKLADGAAYGPESTAWRYVSDPKESLYSPFLSGAQRLPNGNTLICSGIQGDIFEVDQSGRTVWRLKSDARADLSRPPAGPGPNSPGVGGPPGPPQPPGGPGSNPLPLPPLISILDVNSDGVIDANEVAQASTLLRKLDKDADGRVTIDECLPAPGGAPGGPPTPGGPGGPGGQGGPPLPPIFTTLDTNGDRVFDSEELAEATGSLKKLDANKDGSIGMDESLPRRPGGLGGPGSQQGPGGGFPGPPGGPGSGPGGPRPLPPIVTVFEPDRDGTIAADAIARASELLKKLDRDGDGALAITECLPPRPGSPSGPPPGTDPAARPPGQQGPPPFLPPIIAALDTNGDTVISAPEIASASAALAKLDKNGDGRISMDESLPGPPGGPPGPGAGDPASPGPGRDKNGDGRISMDELLSGQSGGPPAPSAGNLPIPGAGASPGLFRAVRFGLDYPAFKGRTLAPLPRP